jgi:DNA mismatch endonuclease, patch repair protein
MDVFNKRKRSHIMSLIRSENTLPERIVSKLLRRNGVYFAKNAKSVTGRPDFLFRRKKLAVFIDSDFWHGHPTRFKMPKSNVEFWSEKIGRNKRRDRRVVRILRNDGWKVLRLWEYDVKKRPEKSIERIMAALK